jgi:uncharacterized repeat protein (TIGR01451 family)
VTTVAADAEGNWWGHNSPTTNTSASTFPRDIFTGLGANVDYTPRIMMSLDCGSAVVPGDGVSTAYISLTMRCTTCTPPYDVLDGTVITFTSSLGSFGVPPVQRLTSGGQAFAGLQSTVLGVSYITATTPLQSVSCQRTFIPGPPFTVTMTAVPPFVIAGAGPLGPATIYVTVTDIAGNLITDTTATAFDWTSGLGASVSPIATNLDGTGHVTTTFYGGTIAGTAWVTATVGTAVGSTLVQILPASPSTVILDPSPARIPGDGVSTGMISATVRDLYGNLVQDGTMVGFATSLGTLPCQPAEAESAEVTTSFGWVPVPNALASGGAYLQTILPGAWARWTFTGSAVSLIYERFGGGGSVDVLVDGALRRTVSMSGPGFPWQRETVIASGLDPAVPHLLEVQVVSGLAFIDAFRCGATTVNGVATTVLTAPRLCATGAITATAIEHRLEAVAFPRPWGSRTVDFTCADVTISKSASTTEVEPLELVTFTLAYRNLGQATATNVVVTDTLPVTLTYVSSVSAPEVGVPSNPTGNVWVWQVGNVLPGASGVITLTAQNGAVPWLGSVTNRVKIGTDMLETDPQNNSDSVRLELIPARPFAIVIRASPSSIWVNDGVHNYQSSIAVTVTDQFGNPAVGSVVTFTWSSGFDAVVAPATRVLNANGRATSVLSAGTVAGTVVVTATVDGVSRAVPVEIMPGPACSITLDPVPSAIAADGVSTATITARVHDCYGNPAYDGTKVGFATTQGSLPLLYLEAENPPVITSAGDWNVGWNAEASGGQYLYTDTPGAWLSTTFTGTAVSLVYVRDTDGGSANVYIDGVPVKTVSMYAPSMEWLREWVLATDLDPDALHHIEVRCNSGRVFVDALQIGYTTHGGVATVVLTSARIATTAIITGTAVDSRIEATTGLHNQARVPFLPADLTITKGVDPAVSRPGEYVTFTLYYANAGQAQGTNAVITDTLPAALMFIDSQSAPDVEPPQYLGGNVWRWQLGHVQPGASGIITMTTWLQYAPGLCQVENAASIGSLTLDSTADNTAFSSVSWACPNLGITKEAFPSQLWPREFVTFTIHYRNDGEIAAAGMMVSDTLPTALNYVSSVSVPDLGAPLNPSYNVWVWQVGNLAPGASGQIMLTAQRRARASLGVVTNTVTAGTAVGDSDPTNNSATARVTLLAGPPVDLILDAIPDSIWILTGTSELRAIVLDVDGNPVSDGTPVIFSTSLGGFPSVQQQVRYTTNGEATQTLTAGSIGGIAYVTATVGSLVATRQVEFRYVPGDPDSVRFLSVEPGVIPDCVGQALATVLVLDHNGNPVRDGTVVSFMVAPTGEANPIDGGRTTNGYARAIIAAGMEPVPAIVKAIVGDQHTSISASFPITFIVGPPDRLENLSAQPPELAVGGNTSTIKVRVLDCSDRYPVTDGTVVTFTLASGLGALSPLTTTTANGWAYSALTSPDETGTALVRVRAGEREATLLVVYIPGPPFDVAVMPSPLSIAANGVSTSTILAEVKDQYGNFVADGTRIEFSTTLGRFVTGPSTTGPTFNTTTLGGWAKAILISSDTPGVARVAAEAGGKRGEDFVEFYYVPGPTPTPTRTSMPTPTPTATRVPGHGLYLPLLMKNRWR